MLRNHLDYLVFDIEHHDACVCGHQSLLFAMLFSQVSVQYSLETFTHVRNVRKLTNLTETDQVYVIMLYMLYFMIIYKCWLKMHLIDLLFYFMMKLCHRHCNS